MHVAYQKTRKPNRWVSEPVESFADIQPGAYFFGKAAAEHSQFYADWCNEHPDEASDVMAIERLKIFAANGAASA